MKRFKLHGNTAYWNGLKLKSLNLATLREEETSPIPNGKRMYVNVVDNLYEVSDSRKEILVGEVSDSDKDYILAKLKNSVPNFLLTLNGKVVGYANLHHRHGAKVDTTAPATAPTEDGEPIDIFGGIVDGNLALLIIPATATAPARKKTEETEYYVSQTLTISVTTKVKAESVEDAKRKAPDFRGMTEDFLQSNFGDNFVTSDYYTEAYKA
jgi:hypothetical protein